MDLGPFRHLHKILTARQHSPETQDDDVHERMFEILSLSARIHNRLQPLHQCAGRRGHTPSFDLWQTWAALSILTPSFYKGLSAFAVAHHTSRWSAMTAATWRSPRMRPSTRSILMAPLTFMCATAP